VRKMYFLPEMVEAPRHKRAQKSSLSFTHAKQASLEIYADDLLTWKSLVDLSCTRKSLSRVNGAPGTCRPTHLVDEMTDSESLIERNTGMMLTQDCIFRIRRQWLKHLHWSRDVAYLTV
jgi:hypothetical protein